MSGKTTVAVDTAGIREQPKAASAGRQSQARRRAGGSGRVRTWRGVTSFVIFALAWEFVGRFVLTGRYAFAPLSVIFVTAVHQFASGAIYPDITASFLELFWGFLAAGVLAIGLGIFIGVSDTASDYVLPLGYAINATPIIALAPLLIVVLGIGILSKVVVIFLLCYFPILINTVAGMRNVDPALVEAAVAFGATRRQVIQKVMLPNAVAFIVAGLRVALGRGFVGVIVAELYGAKAGLGWLVWYASEQMNASLLFVGVLILAVAGVVSTFSLDYLERRIAPWRHA
jgi:ABC-type nitrate/sulfonate/bicarbonate transport system permease component